MIVGTRREFGLRRIKDSNVMVGKAFRVYSDQSKSIICATLSKDVPQPVVQSSTAIRKSDQIVPIGYYDSEQITHHHKSEIRD